LEAFEDRLTPATLTVNSAADTANNTDPYLTLREAIAIVNSPTLPTDLSEQILGQISGTLHAGGADTIAFDPAAVTGPIVLGGSQLELALPVSTAAVTIDGGSAGVTVDGNNASRVLQIDVGVEAAVNHLTVTHGQVQGPANGGGIMNAGTLTLTSSTVSANSGMNGGGGIENTGALTLSGSTVSANSALGGGGIDSTSGTLTVSNSTLSANLASYQGGGIDISNSTVTVSGSTLAANSVTANSGARAGGGGIYFYSGSMTLSNSTLSGNYAYAGGGIESLQRAALTVSNSTISSNSAGLPGGGGILNGQGTLTLQNTIVAGNQSARLGRLSLDLVGPVDDSSRNNLVGVGERSLSGISNGSGGNLVGTAEFPIDPRLGPLADNGGPTPTRAVLADSPARGAGTTTGAPATDQRGLPRVVGGEIDIGAYQTQGPVAGARVVFSAPGGVTDPPVDHVRLTFNHPIDPTTFTPAQASLSGPAGAIALTAVAAVSGSGGQQFDLSFVAQSQPGGYSLSASPAVQDVYGNPLDDPSPHLITLAGLPGSLLTVNSIADTASDSDPYLSLREAIALVNSPSLPDDLSPQILAQISGALHSGGTDTIAFDPDAVTGAIVLGGTQLELSLPISTAAVTIDGGTAGVTVDANATSRVLQVDAGTRVSLRHLTLTHGQAVGGGAGIANAGNLTVTGCTVTASWGGISNFTDGTLTVGNSTISGNSAGDGGGLYNDLGATMTVTDSTLSGNTAERYGGGIYNFGADLLTVTGCTLSGNSAFQEGGGIYNNIDGSLSVSNSTLFDNTGGSYGGGLSVDTRVEVTVADCTITSNHATRYSGGGIHVSGISGFRLLNSIVAGNQCGSDLGLDILGDLDNSSRNNLVGIGDRVLSGISNGSGGNLVGNAGFPIDPRLGPLADKGGPTPTQAVLADSPARGAGTTAGAPATDQRGLPRVVGGEIDIGAYQTQGPVAGARVVLSAPGGVTQPPVDHVRLTLNHPIDATTFTPSQASLTGPAGTISLTAVAAVPGSGGQQFDISFAAQTRPGDYYLAAGTAVLDVYGNPLDDPSPRLFSLSGSAPCTLTVNSSLDTANPSDPYLTLREALAIVNSHTLPSGLSPQILARISGNLHAGGSDVIVFDPDAVTGPIVLGGSQLELALPVSTAAVTIDGGSAGVTVDGNNASRVLQIDVGVEAAVNHLTVTHGVAQGFLIEGGGIMNAGTLTLTNSTLSANSAEDGGDLGNEGLLTVSDCSLSAGSASSGGGIYNGQLGTMRVSHCTLMGNSGSNFGGGISNYSGTLTVSNTTLSANSGHQGGGIYTSGPLTVSNSTLSANSGSQGGGIFIFGVDPGASLVLQNSTLESNSASVGGGGIDSFQGSVTVSNSTLSGNSAPSGGGILAGGSPPLILQNTIAAKNTGGSGPDINGRVQSGSSYNLVGAGDSTLTGISDGVNHNQIGTIANPIDPLLAPLGDYGGLTQTRPLLPDSPALDTGDRAQAGTSDQRGVVRSGGVNIGAFQASAAGLSVAAPAFVSAGQLFDVSVSAFDPFEQAAVGYTGTVTLSSTDPLASLPDPHTFTLADGGTFTFTGVVLATPGMQTVSASDGQLAGSADVTVNQTTAVAFRIDAPAVVTAGQLFDFTVSAVDADGNVDPNYVGSFHLGITPDAPDLGVSVFTPADHGVVGFTGIGLYLAGAKTITATGDLVGSASLTVNAAAAVAFRIDAPAAVAAGQSFDFTVAAVDPYGNVDTSYVGSFHLGIFPEAPDLGVSAFTPADHGVVDFTGFGLYLAGVQTIVASGDLVGQAALTVNPGAAVALVLAGPANATAGMPFPVTVTALDAWGNVASGYQGTVTFSSDDPAGSLPADYAFQPADQGTQNFTLTLATPGIHRVTVTDTSDPTLTGFLDVTVSP
jgi:hypothetical protein